MRRPSPDRAGRPTDARNEAPRTSSKRERQTEARQTRQRLRRRARLGLAAKRAAIRVAAVAALALTLSLLFRASGAKPIPESATLAANAAGCGNVKTPESDPARSHLAADQVFRYTNEPATAGPHDPSPLPAEPHVYTSPVPETNAVHNLEHG